MWAILFTEVLLVAIFALFKKQIYNLTSKNIYAKIVQYITIATLVILTIFFGYMGLGEMLGGDFSGISHIITALLLCVIIYLLAYKPKNIRLKNK